MERPMRVSQAAAHLLGEIFGANVYLVWFSREDNAWIAVRKNAMGLSGIGDSPECAMAELGVAIALREEHLTSERQKRAQDALENSYDRSDP